MKEKLTREEALNLHRQMWTDMLLELGNNPNVRARVVFKRNWLQTHNYEGVECNCFLCEYVSQQQKMCEFCPIDWSPLSAEEDSGCGDNYIHNNSDSFKNIWQFAPIDEILNLPEREGV